VAEVTQSMRTLNEAAAEASLSSGLPVHSCTDVTGFGLIGQWRNPNKVLLACSRARRKLGLP
jgi:selenophosphate synthase